MSVTIGASLGSHEITALLGKGGMGEVYRARDSRLKREVAIKILPEEFSSDADRVNRFQREAEMLASLNHPNIAAIHSLEEADGERFLVLELVEGETLADRLERGAIPIDEALNIARSIGEALEAAHDKGIVHRDLKPANVKITPDGKVKVLDFGLAKALDKTHANPTLSNSPTLMSGTIGGMILGTAAYMSPEQARGRPVDKRADIWAFGLVLYEMLTGKQLFGGEDLTETLASVVKEQPKLDDAPLQVQRLLRKCLEKDPQRRLRDMGDAWELLETTEPAPHTRKSWIAWTGVAVFAVLALAGWLRPRPETANPATDLILTIVPTSGSLARAGYYSGTPYISPDGSAVIFYGPSGALLRRLNSLDQEPVRGLAVDQDPGFWSSDSKNFVFADGGSLKKMRLPDGAAEVISKGVVGPTLNGSVSDNGTILFSAESASSALYMSSSGASEIKPVGVTGLGEGVFALPEFLPGSEDFLFLHEAFSTGERGIYLATLRDGKTDSPVLLMRNETAGHYTPAGGGRILFVRDDNLYAQRLNRTAKKLEGEPELIQRGVASSPAYWSAHFSVSRAGVVAWRSGRAGLSQVTVLDRHGSTLGTAGPPVLVQTLRLAPDEMHLLLAFNSTAWLLEPNRPGLLRLDQGSLNMIWSPDGTRFLQAIPGPKGPHLIERPITGSSAVRELPTPPGFVHPLDVSENGKILLFNRGTMDTNVFSARLDGVKEDPRSLVQTGETIGSIMFAPDGRWIVYEAFGQGSAGIYVQEFPGPGVRRQITSTGHFPVWRKDGREIVYLDRYQDRDYIWSVPVTAAADLGAPTPLLPVRLPAATFSDLNFLAVSRDGSRFYIPQAVDQPGSDVIHIRIGGIK
jgi:serine/threonine protein kinase